jgi:hypothetical protein
MIEVGHLQCQQPQRTRFGEEAALTIGVSGRERLGLICRIRRTPALAFAPPEWLAADALDEGYFRLVPGGKASSCPMMWRCGRACSDGELAARRLN